MMDSNAKTHRAILQRIARRAMIGRGLLPDFSPEALSELERINAPRINGERFDAIVTGAATKGTWVRLLQMPIEGKLVQGFKGMEVGRRIRVQLIQTDVEQGFVDFKKVDSNFHGC
jgi:hypothetical protein